MRVVGTGPAGLAAAEVIARAGHRVTVIDHHASPSRKFLLAGRGGLNLTHSEDLEQLLGRYGSARNRLEPIIRAFPPKALIEWCQGLGVETFVGTSGRVFPKCMKASPLLRAWLRRLSQLGVQLQLNKKWEGFDALPTVLALGGASWPELGSDGTWRKLFEVNGISVSPFSPSNVRQPIKWSDSFSQRFAGQPIKNVSVTSGNTTVRGEVMISRNGIEGGAIYASSAALRETGSFTLNLKPDLTPSQIAERQSRPRGRDSRSTFLRKAFNLTPVAIGLMREVGALDPSALHFSINGQADMRRAISTSGGVDWQEVAEDLSLRKFPNVFVAGEMLDWDAPTGGYLLQASFSTGVWAGQSLVRSLETN